MRHAVFTDEIKNKKELLFMSFNDIFKSSFLENITSVLPLDMVISLALAFGIGLFIFLIYKKPSPA